MAFPRKSHSFAKNYIVMELTRNYIEELKKNSNGKLKLFVSQVKKDNAKVIYLLDNLGKLPRNFDGTWIYDFAISDNPKIRLGAVKNLGKLKEEKVISFLSKQIKEEEDTTVRREIVSSIGRQRNPISKDILLEILKDEDPKIVCQAIRALLVFRKDEKIIEELKPLVNHQNEMVRTVIYKEFFAKKKEKSAIPHTETYNYLKNKVVHGDVRDVLKNVEDESIHLTFTSPPYYNARDYSIYPSYQDYLDFLAEVFKEIHRITKEGRFLIVNTSPIIIPRISRQHSSKRYPIPFDIHNDLVNMGWEFIDDIIWLKSEASVKNRNAGFLQHRKPLGYKPNAITEYLMVYRKETTRLIDWNIKEYDKKVVNESKVKDGYETSNVWKIDPTFNKVHSAVFPVELCKRVIQYYSFEGDIVFDPFGGSGTVGRTAKALNRLFFLTEKDDNYFDYMKKQAKPNAMFDEQKTEFLELTEFKALKSNDINTTSD